MPSREELTEIIDTASCQENVADVLEMAEEIAPGNPQVRGVLQDLHETYFLSEDTLQYYVDRLERVLS